MDPTKREKRKNDLMISNRLRLMEEFDLESINEHSEDENQYKRFR